MARAQRSNSLPSVELEADVSQPRSLLRLNFFRKQGQQRLKDELDASELDAPSSGGRAPILLAVSMVGCGLFVLAAALFGPASVSGAQGVNGRGTVSQHQPARPTVPFSSILPPCSLSPAMDSSPPPPPLPQHPPHLCELTATLTRLQAPEEHCNSDRARRSSRTECLTHYVALASGKLTRCAYDEATATCKSSHEAISCISSPSPPATAPPSQLLAQWGETAFTELPSGLPIPAPVPLYYCAPFCTEHYCGADCCSDCKPYNEGEPPILYFHVEKTGGSSIECR